MQIDTEVPSMDNILIFINKNKVTKLATPPHLKVHFEPPPPPTEKQLDKPPEPQREREPTASSI